jgi:hypothetical protein
LQLAVFLFADAAVDRVDEVLDLHPARQSHLPEISQCVVLVVRAARSCSFLQEVARRVVLVGIALPGLQPVFAVVAGYA